MNVNKKLENDLSSVIKNAIRNDGVTPQDAIRTVIHILEGVAFEAEEKM